MIKRPLLEEIRKVLEEIGRDLLDDLIRTFQGLQKLIVSLGALLIALSKSLVKHFKSKR